MFHKLSELISKVDMFAHQPTLGYKSRRKYYTAPGGLMSIFIGLFMIELSVTQL